MTNTETQQEMLKGFVSDIGEIILKSCQEEVIQ